MSTDCHALVSQNKIQYVTPKLKMVDLMLVGRKRCYILAKMVPYTDMHQYFDNYIDLMIRFSARSLSIMGYKFFFPFCLHIKSF